jgi:hypothetical protein
MENQMAASASAHVEDHGDYIENRSWFIGYSVALVFGIIWAILGESDMKLVFITVAFILFLRSGVKTEMSARALNPDHH